MIRSRGFSLLLAAALLVNVVALPSAANAQERRDWTAGLGALTQFGDGIRPAQLSAKFSLTPKLEVSGLLGMNLGSPYIFVPGTKFNFILLSERRMNVYAAVTAAVDLRSGGVGLHSFLYQVGPGFEFFVDEWPNVGFSLEIGLAGEIRSGSSPTWMGTAQTGFGQAGIHYYF